MEEAFYTHTMKPDFEIFGFTLRYYGVLFACTFLIGYFLMRRLLMQFGHPEEKPQNFYFFALAGTVIGARAIHVFFYDMDSFLARPGMIVEVWTGGLASHGGVLGLVLACVAYAKIGKIPFFQLLDGIALPAAVAGVLVRIGNFTNGELVGRPTDLAWGMIFPRYGDIARHPSQLYEAGYGLIVLIVALLIDRWRWKKFEEIGYNYAGIIFFTNAIHYTMWRFAGEYTKEYQALSSDFPFTMGQLLSIPFWIAGVAGTVWLLKRGQRVADEAQGKKAASAS